MCQAPSPFQEGRFRYCADEEGRNATSCVAFYPSACADESNSRCCSLKAKLFANESDRFEARGGPRARHLECGVARLWGGWSSGAGRLNLCATSLLHLED